MWKKKPISTSSFPQRILRAMSPPIRVHFHEDADEAAQRQLDVGLFGCVVSVQPSMVKSATRIQSAGFDALKEKAYDEVIISTLPSGDRAGSSGHFSPGRAEIRAASDGGDSEIGAC